jgi:hypothetical protein
VGIRHSVTGARSTDHDMPWIVVDSDGRRFLNEYPPAPQDTPIRDLVRFDPDTQSYPRIPGFMICDEPGRLRGPLGRPAMNDPAIAYEWSIDNSREIADGHIRSSDTLEGLATVLGVEPRQLTDTVNAWNAPCGEGDPAGLGRSGWTMHPISTPPFYGIEVVPVITNTQGGVATTPSSVRWTPSAHRSPVSTRPARTVLCSAISTCWAATTRSASWAAGSQGRMLRARLLWT